MQWLRTLIRIKILLESFFIATFETDVSLKLNTHTGLFGAGKVKRLALMHCPSIRSLVI